MKNDQEKARAQAEAKQEADEFMRTARMGATQKLAAFETIARKYRKPMLQQVQFAWGWALDKVGKTADDYVTDAFAKLWKSILTFDNRNGRGLFPYIYRIASNAILSDLKTPMVRMEEDAISLMRHNPAGGNAVRVAHREAGTADSSELMEAIPDARDAIGHLEIQDCMERVTDVLEKESPLLAAIVRLLRAEEEHADIARAVGVDADNFRKYYLFKTRQKVDELMEQLC